MIIAIDSQGNCKSVLPQSVYQGSVGVNEIVLIAPFPSSSTVQIGFILPTGLYKFGDNGENYVPMTFVETHVDEAVNVWSYKLPLAITDRQGEVEVSFRAPSPDLSEGLTTYLCKFTVSPSVVPELPDAPTDDVYADILAQLGQLNGRTAQVPTSVYKVTQTHPNAFTVTQNNGATSEIVIGNEDFPEGVSYDPAYATPALVINVGANGWEYDNNGHYSCTVNAGSQLVGGATAQDLWVTFETVYNGIYGDFAPDYSINAEGMITITATHAAQMVVKVWNGKGLYDSVAVGLAQEIERAKGAEKQLQNQINEIEISGKDLIARQEIANETARAKAAEAQLQSDIDENAAETRAIKVAQGDMAIAVTNNTNDIHMLQESAPKPSTSVPLADGTASAGVSTNYAREDHVHPTNIRVVQTVVQKTAWSTSTKKATVSVSGMKLGTTLVGVLPTGATYNNVLQYNIRVINYVDGSVTLECDEIPDGTVFINIYMFG